MSKPLKYLVESARSWVKYLLQPRLADHSYAASNKK